ncbi:2-amino-4-hydroxy-6-hydroxymethyldihydropteridine diphosphokinase [Algoriphagus formosus]|uniref:2-amino-4-hydroxy-6-hydroxymethyldihydropteridine pyrophosphokinase n=1 Tax=Algoriphagus formosus TaxID=2007308 RepID=A0A4R5VF79_9BACT|nr:2-amino-4-hydroxy-6-hydroxymethyldihydropteridine diphosphokinase [Algoriphagus aquimaris]TDK50490.1 2-amino-4-hydroxy-6-hydroxymethyldihydropteridine diphosphokinase [Algoriphagus aquimaris]
MVQEVVLILGGNLGDREQLIREAKQMLVSKALIKGESSIFSTEAWGGKAEGEFLNQVLLVSTEEVPLKFLSFLQTIERDLGREREVTWGDRTMDIDILYWEGQEIQVPNLIIPHPHLHKRRFVLAPLAELLPDWVHPKLNKNSLELLEACEDESKVKKWKK